MQRCGELSRLGIGQSVSCMGGPRDCQVRPSHRWWRPDQSRSERVGAGSAVSRAHGAGWRRAGPQRTVRTLRGVGCRRGWLAGNEGVWVVPAVVYQGRSDSVAVFDGKELPAGQRGGLLAWGVSCIVPPRRDGPCPPSLVDERVSPAPRRTPVRADLVTPFVFAGAIRTRYHSARGHGGRSSSDPVLRQPSLPGEL